MKVWYIVRTNYTVSYIIITYWILINNKGYSLIITRHKRNRKRYDPKRLLISSNQKFNPSGILEFSPSSSFELEDDKIKFDIP